MASATFSVTNSTLDDNNLFKTDFVCETAGASPYQDCQMQLSYYSPSAQGDVSLDSVYGTADGEGNAVLTYHLDGNRDVGGETLASIIFPSNSSTTSINCVASNSAGIIGFERFTLTLDAPPIFSDVTISSNRGDGVYVQGVTTINVSAKIEPRFGSSIESAAVYLTDNVGGSEHIGMAYSTPQNKWFGHVNVTHDIHSGNALLSIQATSGRGIYNHNIAEIIVQEHAFPSITVDCFRCDSNGDRDMNGNYISVTGFASSNPVELGISVLRGRVHIYPGGEEPVVWTNLTNGVPTLFGEGTITPEDAYRVAVVASDNHYTSTKEIIIPPVNRIINVKDGGTGIAFGKLATEDALLDSVWDINTDGEYLVQGQPLVDTLPDADATTRGLVSTGTQHFGGMKYFDYGNIVLDSVGRPSAVSFRQIAFKDGNIQSGGNTVQNAVILSQTSGVGSSSDNVMAFRLKSPTADGTGYTAYYDTFALPTATAGLTAGKTYQIITTKNIGDIPDASETQAGKVSTDEQWFNGDKHFNGTIHINNHQLRIDGRTAAQGITIAYLTDVSGTEKMNLGQLVLARSTTNGIARPSRWYFVVYSYNSTTGERTAGYETYRLPTVSAGLTSAKNYNIWTTKEVPEPPTTAGTYTLKATRTSSGVTYSWV